MLQTSFMHFLKDCFNSVIFAYFTESVRAIRVAVTALLEYINPV